MKMSGKKLINEHRFVKRQVGVGTRWVALEMKRYFSPTR